MLSGGIALAVSLWAFAIFCNAQDTSLAEVRQAFTQANIPRTMSINFNPNTLLEVAFPQASSHPVLVKAGVQLPRNQTAIPPMFAIKGPTVRQHTETFVVSMVDLDALTPQNPNVSQIRHFLGGNFRLEDAALGHSGVALLRNNTPAISDFLQPTPPAGSDPHRYVFFVWNQPANFNQVSPHFVNASTSIMNFNISLFAEQTGLGTPLGGSFILVGPDPSS